MFPQKSYNTEYRENIMLRAQTLNHTLSPLACLWDSHATLSRSRCVEALRDGPSNGGEKRLINMEDNKQPFVDTMLEEKNLSFLR